MKNESETSKNCVDQIFTGENKNTIQKSEGLPLACFLEFSLGYGYLHLLFA